MLTDLLPPAKADTKAKSRARARQRAKKPDAVATAEPEGEGAAALKGPPELSAEAPDRSAIESEPFRF